LQDFKRGVDYAKYYITICISLQGNGKSFKRNDDIAAAYNYKVSHPTIKREVLVD